jgi:hypothetical protein
MIAYHGTAALFDAFDADFRGENTNYDGAELATFLALDPREAGFYAEMSADRLRDAGEETDERILMVEVSDDLNLLIIDGEGDLADLIESDRAALRHARAHGFDGVRWPGGNASNCGDTLAIFSNSDLTIVGRYARRAA